MMLFLIFHCVAWPCVFAWACWLERREGGR